MGELVTALVAAIRALGLSAVARFPAEEMPRLTHAVTAVGLQKAETVGSGFADYLGTFEENGGLTERYGKRLTADLLCRVYAPDGDSAMTAAETLCGLLMGPVGGLQARQTVLGPCVYDREADCFTMDVTVTVTAHYLAALPPEQEPTFRDFRLESECI